MKGIPTVFNGINFRSRLEAKWAMLFDLLGWKFEYEPFDLEGWIPDFLITNAANPILVEVKPITHCSIDWKNREPYDHWCFEFQKVTDKIDRTSWDKEVLIVGVGPWEDDQHFGSVHFGWLGEFENLGLRRSWSTAFAYESYGYKVVGFGSSEGSWRDRITGAWDGKNHIANYDPPLLDLWKRVSNELQWKPK